MTEEHFDTNVPEAFWKYFNLVGFQFSFFFFLISRCFQFSINASLDYITIELLINIISFFFFYINFFFTKKIFKSPVQLYWQWWIKPRQQHPSKTWSTFHILTSKKKKMINFILHNRSFEAISQIFFEAYECIW